MSVETVEFKGGAMPDGKFTEDLDEFYNSWKQLYVPIEMATGWKTFGFNPGVAMHLHGSNWSVDLPMPFAKSLSKALKAQHILMNGKPGSPIARALAAVGGEYRDDDYPGVLHYGPVSCASSAYEIAMQFAYEKGEVDFRAAGEAASLAVMSPG